MRVELREAAKYDNRAREAVGSEIDDGCFCEGLRKKEPTVWK
jgi:hypothetical protein